MRGTTINLKPISTESYLDKMKTFGLPQHVLEDLGDFASATVFGYYFGKETSEEQLKVRKGLARKPRTFEEFLRANPDFFAA